MAAPGGPTRFGIADWGLSLSLSSGKAEVYRAKRPDLAHLTISWKRKVRNVEGEVIGYELSDYLDVHLTYGHEQALAAKARDKDWRPFARIPMSELERLGEHAGLESKNLFQRQLVRVLRPVRPGWMGRHGYWVVLAEADKFISLMQALTYKKHRKYHVRHERFQDTDALAQDAGDCMEIFDPYVLHVLDPTKLTKPIIAVTERHGHARIFLFPVPLPGPEGGVRWMSMREKDMSRTMNKLLSAFYDWMVPRMRPEHAAKLEELLRGLGTDDFEFTRDLGDGFRQFFANPRNPVRMPYPKVRRPAAAVDCAEPACQDDLPPPLRAHVDHQSDAKAGGDAE